MPSGGAVVHMQPDWGYTAAFRQGLTSVPPPHDDSVGECLQKGGSAGGSLWRDEAGPAGHDAAYQLAEQHPDLAERVCEQPVRSGVCRLHHGRPARPGRLCLHALWRGHAPSKGVLALLSALCAVSVIGALF